MRSSLTTVLRASRILASVRPPQLPHLPPPLLLDQNTFEPPTFTDPRHSPAIVFFPFLLNFDRGLHENIVGAHCPSVMTLRVAKDEDGLAHGVGEHIVCEMLDI